MSDVNYRDYLLTVCFPEGIYSAILNYLTIEGLVTFGDYLDLAELIDIASITGVGVTKVKKFEERVKDITNGDFDPNVVNTSRRSTTSKKGAYMSFTGDEVKLFNVNKVFRNTPLSLMNRKFTERLNKLGVMVLTDLNTFTPNTLFEILEGVSSLGVTRKEKLVKNIRSFEQDFNVYMNEEIRLFKLNNRNYETLKCRIEGKTLEEIGQNMNLTRERVRQKQNNAFSDLAILMYGLTQYYIDNGIISKDKRISVYDLYNNIDNIEIVDIFVFFIKNGMIPKLTYSEKLDLILYDRLVSVTEEVMLHKFKNYGKMFNLDMQLDVIYDDLQMLGLDFLSQSDIKHFLLSNGYKEYNGYYSFGRLYYENMASFVILKYYKNGFNIEQDYQDIYNLIESEFGVNAFTENDSIHKLRGYFHESTDMILFTDKTKIHIGNVNVPESLLLKIRVKIADMLRDEDRLSINIDNLYEELDKIVPNFKEILPNRYVLYGVSKYYFGDKFTFNRFYVSLKPVKECQDVLVYNLIKSRGCPVSVEEIEQYIGLSPIRLSMMLMTTDLLIYCNNKSAVDCIDEYTKYKPQLNIIYTYIKSVLDKYGYCNTHMVFRKYYKMLEDMDIFDYDTLSNVLRMFYKDELYCGRKPHILKRCMEDTKITYNIIFDAVPRDIIHTRTGTSQFLKNVLCLADCTRHAFMEYYAKYYREYMAKVSGVTE